MTQNTQVYGLDADLMKRGAQRALVRMIGPAETIAANYTVTEADNGATVGLPAGVTLTLNNPAAIPAGMIVQAPAAGGGTIAVSGGATLNGSTTSVVLAARDVAVILPTPGSSTDFTVKVA